MGQILKQWYVFRPAVLLSFYFSSKYWCGLSCGAGPFLCYLVAVGQLLLGWAHFDGS